jgi:RNA polymerase sigma-70 factor (ECF subfamily)
MARSRESRLDELATSHSPAVANYLRRRLYPLTPADLDDLVEEVLIVTWKRLDSIPAGAELPWMIGVARNILFNARRSANRRGTYEARVEGPGSDASAEEYVIADESLRAALAALSDSDREVLLLHFWDGLDPAQLAVVLSVTANAAAVRLSRAQSRFRDLYDGQEKS